MQHSKAKRRENCKQPHIKEAAVEPEMMKIIEEVKLTEELIEQIIDNLKNKYNNEQLYRNIIVSQAQEEYKKLKNRLAVAHEDRMDGRITVNEYDKLANKYKLPVMIKCSQ